MSKCILADHVDRCKICYALLQQPTPNNSKQINGVIFERSCLALRYCSWNEQGYRRMEISPRDMQVVNKPFTQAMMYLFRQIAPLMEFVRIQTIVHTCKCIMTLFTITNRKNKYTKTTFVAIECDLFVCLVVYYCFILPLWILFALFFYFTFLFYCCAETNIMETRARAFASIFSVQFVTDYNRKEECII